MRSVAVFLASTGAADPGSTSDAPSPGPDQVRQRQTDQHRHQGIDQIKDHHEGTDAALDLIGDDRTQDGQDDQRRRERGQGAEDELGHELQAGRAFPPEHPNGNRHDDREDDPDVERQPSRPALRFVLDDGGGSWSSSNGGFSGSVIAGSGSRIRVVSDLPVSVSCAGMWNYGG